MNGRTSLNSLGSFGRCVFRAVCVLDPEDFGSRSLRWALFRLGLNARLYIYWKTSHYVSDCWSSAKISASSLAGRLTSFDHPAKHRSETLFKPDQILAKNNREKAIFKIRRLIRKRVVGRCSRHAFNEFHRLSCITGAVIGVGVYRCTYIHTYTDVVRKQWLKEFHPVPVKNHIHTF